MSEVEKQESQKTVVAFITGLLIGGLLVWVFSSTPTSAPKEEPEKQSASTTSSTQVNKETESVKTDSKKDVNIVQGEGSIQVSDQKAGMTVTLGTTKLPTKSGWIVVRDYMDGTPGNILGAARFSADEGLVPTSVELMRQTTAGSSYQVVFYTNNGDLGFKVADDTIIDGIATTFKAL